VKQHLQNKGDELQLYPFEKNGFLALVYVGMAHTQAPQYALMVSTLYSTTQPQTRFGRSNSGRTWEYPRVPRQEVLCHRYNTKSIAVTKLLLILFNNGVTE